MWHVCAHMWWVGVAEARVPRAGRLASLVGVSGGGRLNMRAGQAHHYAGTLPWQNRTGPRSACRQHRLSMRAGSAVVTLGFAARSAVQCRQGGAGQGRAEGAFVSEYVGPPLSLLEREAPIGSVLSWRQCQLYAGTKSRPTRAKLGANLAFARAGASWCHVWRTLPQHYASSRQHYMST